MAGAIAVLISCGGGGTLERLQIDEENAIDDLHLELPELDTTLWVERYDPERAWDGVNLVMYRRRVPLLMDNGGRIVHLWPRVRATARIRLAEDGRLLVIGTDNLIKEYDWDGTLGWYYQLPEGFTPHHDVAWLANGHVLVLAQNEDEPRGDFLLEVDRSRRVVWRWAASDHHDDFPTWNDTYFYPTHINSIRELPPNRWFDSGDDRFRPGNILVSARNLDTIFIVDRTSGEVVWSFTRRLDRQHEAVMIPKGQLGSGLILVFNNGLKNLHRYRRSAVMAIDPVGKGVPWRYDNRFFYSSIAGTAEPLPNDNVLISSSQGGRVFEITPDRQIVWQWTPPYHPMRPERYPWDHCPQLAELDRPQPQAIPSRRGRPHVDQDLHVFAVSSEFRTRSVAGEARQLIHGDDRCREVMMPPRAQIQLGYGIDLDRLGAKRLTARFRFSFHLPDRDEETVILEDTVDSAAAETWRERWLPVKAKAYRRYELCVDVETEGEVNLDRARRIAVVETPRIYSGDQPSLPASFYGGRLSDQEKKIREQQLRALGYVN